MKTFKEFITEARVSKKQRVFRTVKRVAKATGRQLNRLSKTKPAKAASKYILNTAAGAALRLLTGL